MKQPQKFKDPWVWVLMIHLILHSKSSIVHDVTRYSKLETFWDFAYGSMNAFRILHSCASRNSKLGIGYVPSRYPLKMGNFQNTILISCRADHFMIIQPWYSIHVDYWHAFPWPYITCSAVSLYSNVREAASASVRDSGFHTWAVSTFLSLSKASHKCTGSTALSATTSSSILDRMAT